MMNAANLASKYGLCALNLDLISSLHSTCSLERHAHAARKIGVLILYLRFFCNSIMSMVKNIDNDFSLPNDDGPEYHPTSITRTLENDLAFLKYFFTTMGISFPA